MLCMLLRVVRRSTVSKQCSAAPIVHVVLVFSFVSLLFDAGCRVQVTVFLHCRIEYSRYIGIASNFTYLFSCGICPAGFDSLEVE